MTALFRATEVLFTAYAVPALLVPVVWLALRLVRGLATIDLPWSERLSRMERVYAIPAAALVAAGAGVLLGLPLGGLPARVVAWCVYASANLAFASLLIRFTAGYGAIREEEARDRHFSRLLLIVVAQPVVTAFAFALLYRVMGLPYQLALPALGAVQEGI
jgi:hypothetical protein